KPMDNDNGTISPTAALASMPYVPDESMKALKYFYRERGAELFGKYGPYDAFNDTRNWIKESYIGIDQGPIVVMIENYRTGLLWKNVMKDEDLQSGLDKLEFDYTTSIKLVTKPKGIKIFPNPAKNMVHLSLGEHTGTRSIIIKVFSFDGKLMQEKRYDFLEGDVSLDCSGFQNGFYHVQVFSGEQIVYAKLLIRK
ncbi:MAG: glucoamylase family protein, partial [Draconibacterium sp.]|nr:glucoamylase family protein [Draconibacterium sp.]